MTSDALPATLQSSPEKRELALLRAVGLDKAAPEQRELALAIADRYGLDLMLKHLVLIEGRPYLTRDALLHIAHRSGQLDGMETTEPVLVDGFWRATASVYRKDMSHAFTYSGRYPEKGGNAKFAPEMALKVAESMALRRAFDIAAPSADERWDAEVAVSPPPPRPSLAEVAAEKASAVAADTGGQTRAVAAEIMTEPEPAEHAAAPLCGEPGPYHDDEYCTRPAGHKGAHQGEDRATW